MKFQRFKRGSVVMVEFSPSMGSEIKGKHLAIVLTKNDSPNNGVLTVIPLSSKNKPYYVPIGNFFLNEAIPFLDKQLNEFIENIKNVTDEEKKAMLDNANKFILVAKMYQKMGVDSYAMVQNISTISKLRVLKPINKYDPILNIRVSDEIMTILDNKLIEIIYAFLTIFLYLLKCPQSLILSALRAFCFCGKPHISRSIFLYFRYQTWLKSW